MTGKKLLVSKLSYIPGVSELGDELRRVKWPHPKKFKTGTIIIPGRSAKSHIPPKKK